MTLTEFLLARIADREAMARRMLEAVWPGVVRVRPADDNGPVPEGEQVPLVGVSDPTYAKEWIRVWRNGATDHGWALGDCIEVWGGTTATKILAECEAKRRIVELHRTETIRVGSDEQRREYRACGICRSVQFYEQYPEPGDCRTMRLVALPDADHPDYPVQAADQTDSTAARNDSSGTAV